MNVKEDHPRKLSDLNKKILEIKKKIQLSEGQRKALFEECEAERKANADDVIIFKKDISQLNVSLHDNTTPSASSRIKKQNKKIEEVIGPLEDKTCNQVIELIDLQIIDKSKLLNLLKYEIKKRKKDLSDLGQEYQILVSKKDKKKLKQKVDIPVKKSTCELQNNIHAVEVQMREANHVKIKYTEIRGSLKEDAAKFEKSIKELVKEQELQNEDISKLQQILDEAVKMRGAARAKLLLEEKEATSSANNREKQANEGRKLLTERKQELEKLERRIFQGGKVPPRPEPEGAEDGLEDEEKSETPPHPVETLSQSFEILKRATGVSTIEEVLDRFCSQKDTNERLMLLRKKSEYEKVKLEKKVNNLKTQLECCRYSEVKDAEKKTHEMEEIQKQITDHMEKSRENIASTSKTEDGVKSIMCGIRSLYISINPLSAPKEDEDPAKIIEKIKSDLAKILHKLEEANIDLEETVPKMTGDISDEKWLPPPYLSLVRRTPLPQPGVSPAPPPAGTDDEEEVPSRGYMKRQAQLVIDAKTRRKNIRVLPKRN